MAEITVNINEEKIQKLVTQQITGLKTSAYQLLDAITVALTESGAKSPTVILPLEEYMKRRGLKERKEAKTQAKADMEILRGASFSWEERRGKKTESYSFVKLADSGEIRRNGDIVFTYGNTFYNILLGYEGRSVNDIVNTILEEALREE